MSRTSNFDFRRDLDGKPLWHAPLPNPAFVSTSPYGPDNRPFGNCQLCGQAWPCPDARANADPVAVSAIELRDRDEGRVLEVLAEIDGEWRVVIRTDYISGDMLSHTVSALGMRHSKPEPS